MTSFHSSLWLNNTPYCTCILHSLYPLIGRWAPRLIPHFGWCELCCCTHGCAGVSVVCWLTFLQICAQQW
jgi:hypothetical protein